MWCWFVTLQSSIQSPFEVGGKTPHLADFSGFEAGSVFSVQNSGSVFAHFVVCLAFVSNHVPMGAYVCTLVQRALKSGGCCAIHNKSCLSPVLEGKVAGKLL